MMPLSWRPTLLTVYWSGSSKTKTARNIARVVRTCQGYRFEQHHQSSSVFQISARMYPGGQGANGPRIELIDASVTPGLEKMSHAIHSKLASYIPSFFPLCCVISRFVIITDSDRNLWLAVINLALDDLTATKPPLKRSARAWFLSSNTNVGSFLWVCDRLGLESTAVRRRRFDLIHGVRKT